MIPNWYGLVLLALAAYRIFRLLAEDLVLDRPRAWLLGLPADWKEGQPIPRGYREKLADFITCPWCLGFWVVLAWWGAWMIWPHATLLVAVPFAISTLIGALSHLLHVDE